jgi:hypothetical protein
MSEAQLVEGETGSISKDGVYQYSVPYYVKTAQEVLSVAKDTYKVGGGSLIKEVSRSWVSNAVGYIVTIVYEGGSASGGGGGNKDDEASWDFDFHILEEPIESHWNFSEIKKKYGGWKDPNDETRWVFPDKEPGKEGGTDLSPMKGVTTYMVLHCTASKSYSAAKLPAGILSKVGIAVSELPAGASLDFDTKGRNWLTMPVQATLRGGIWQIYESWKLSEKVVWPAEVYGKAI